MHNVELTLLYDRNITSRIVTQILQGTLLSIHYIQPWIMMLWILIQIYVPVVHVTEMLTRPNCTVVLFFMQNCSKQFRAYSSINFLMY